MSDDYLLMQRCIDRAITLERHQGRFHRAVKRALPRLHRSIDLPPQDRARHLTCFVIRYIECVPEWLWQVEQLCSVAGLDFTPVRKVIGHSFAAPPERHPDQVGLAALLDDAYLAHRALEEINEHLQPACGMPLLPMDPIIANTVVRELLGERFAGEIDSICCGLGGRFRGLRLAPDSLVAMILCRQRFNETPGAWPDFARTLNIQLRPPIAELVSSTLH
ncbi:hypothetical protein SAMN04487965_1973 [Microbulbifer donghaiensis]|uniref:Uncharacterized protein n=1 Tax=Microbulbifer donghaiensis TaxID=494016 RepID=A0A1M5AV03_9GAMM|nr:hypothetical protein [Microbulbifer donghaiensis]SHF33762.1 hypothetical protein SAMN04487965_1973 [Microbulbifer donghaiensis]